jgi:DNA helicase HerA-like ATPase
MITGETGSGKTQAIKALLRDLRARDVPALVLDFKDDYSQRDYVDVEELTVHDASLGGLSFNPMTPPTDPQTGRVNVVNHVHQFSEIVKRIYSLGDQQVYKFREALKDVYTRHGVALQPFTPSDSQSYPPFDAIHEVLAQKRDNDALLGRLSPIFDLSLFAANPDVSSFADLIERSSVVRLSQLPGDEVKNAVAEFFLMALYNNRIRRQHPHVLESLLVLDEAWRLTKSPFLEPLMREGRALGLGVVIATQFPGDLPPHVAGSTATKLFFSQTKSDHVREVQRALVGKTSGVDAEHVAAALRELPPLTCFVQSSQYQPSVRTAISPYYARVAHRDAGESSMS